jgi:hypothetical protein
MLAESDYLLFKLGLLMPQRFLVPILTLAAIHLQIADGPRPKVDRLGTTIEST